MVGQTGGAAGFLGEGAPEYGKARRTTHEAGKEVEGEGIYIS